MKKLYLQTLSFVLLGLSLGGNAQQVSQRLLPPVGGTSSDFGHAVILDSVTLIVSDPAWKSNQVADSSTGAVFVYKKGSNQWNLTQTLTSGTNSRFGSTFSFRNNVLVVGAPAEDGSVKDDGSVYVYRRSSDNVPFVLLTKLKAKPDSGYPEINFGGTSVATNGKYILTNGSSKYYAYFYRIEEDSIRLIKRLLIPSLGGRISFASDFRLTDNNTAVLSDGDFYLMKIKGDSVMLKHEFWLNYKSDYTGIMDVDGNTIGSMVYGNYQDANHNVGFIHTNENDDTLSYSSSELLPYSFYTNTYRGGNLSFRNNEYIFNTFTKNDGLSVPQITVYKNTIKGFYPAGTIERTDTNASRYSFGMVMDYSNGILAVGDTGYRVAGNKPGAVLLYKLDQPFVKDTTEGQTIAISPFRDDKDNFAKSVAAGKEFAAVSGLDNDLTDSSGAVFLYRKVNGKWQFQTKIYSPHFHLPQHNDGLGHSLAVSGKYVVAGAPYSYDYYRGPYQTGMVYIYEHQDDSYRKGLFSYSFANPEEGYFSEEWQYGYEEFGYDVALDSNILAVSAPLREMKGAVYIFKKSGNGSWDFKQKIMPGNLRKLSRFGESIALKNGHLLVGSPYEDNNGALYLYKWQDTSFVLANRWDSEAGGAHAGASVGISADYAAAGFAKGTGVVVLKRNGNTWLHSTSLQPFSDSARTEVSIGETALLASSGNNAGNAMVAKYELSGHSWVATSLNHLGEPVENAPGLALSGEEVLIGYHHSQNSDKSFALFTQLNKLNNIPTAISTGTTSANTTGFLSPNPYAGSESLRVSMEGATALDVYTLNGAHQGTFGVKNGRSEVGELAPGIYTVKITGTATVKVEKLVVR